MATRRSRTATKKKQSARVVLVVDTPDDDVLDTLVAAVEKALGRVEDEVEVDLTLAASLAPPNGEVTAATDLDDEEDDLDTEADEDDDYLTLADLKKMHMPEIKKLAKQYGIRPRNSWKKQNYIDAIIEIAGEGDEDDDED